MFMLLDYNYITSASTLLPDGLDRYVVRKGDTCWEIAGGPLVSWSRRVRRVIVITCKLVEGVVSAHNIRTSHEGQRLVGS